jgi:hypothetical protein
MDKKQKITRKMLQKIKNRSKHAMFDIDSLQKEIYGYQFQFVDQPSWNQPFSATWNHSRNDMKNKGQQQKSPEVRK